jgi:hypothetical protein
MMSGWKTWLAVVAMLSAGVWDIVNGDFQSGLTKILAALALLGIGGKLSKIEKSK